MSGSAVDYRIRVSAHARCVRLCVTPEKGLEVVVPRGFDTAKVSPILEGSKRWISAALARLELRRKALESTPSWQVPAQVELPASGSVWHIEARRTGARRVSVRELEGWHLRVSGAIESEAACRDALARWLMRRARVWLIPRLQSISSRTGLQYKRASVRRQATRWASCSARRTISLNAKLLLLPPDLVDYVLVHELCHLREMNHSRRFWDLVHQYHPDCHMQASRLREFWRSVPRWAS